MGVAGWSADGLSSACFPPDSAVRAGAAVQVLCIVMSYDNSLYNYIWFISKQIDEVFPKRRSDMGNVCSESIFQAKKWKLQ